MACPEEFNRAVNKALRQNLNGGYINFHPATRMACGRIIQLNKRNMTWSEWRSLESLGITIPPETKDDVTPYNPRDPANFTQGSYQNQVSVNCSLDATAPIEGMGKGEVGLVYRFSGKKTYVWSIFDSVRHYLKDPSCMRTS
jgi:hypothetical protein